MVCSSCETEPPVHNMNKRHCPFYVALVHVCSVVTYNCECLYVQHEHGELDDFVNEVRRVDFQTRGLKVQDQEVVQGIGVGLHRVEQVPRRTGLFQNDLLS